MALYKRGTKGKTTKGIWWYSFNFAGKRIQESTKTTRLTLAREAERQRRRELEGVHAGVPLEERALRIRSVSEVVKLYLETYGANHRPKSLEWTTGRLAHIKRLMGSLLLPDLTEDRAKRYISVRKQEGAGNRTINMELGELTRAIATTWKTLWPKLKKMDEPKDIGRALSSEEETCLLEAASRSRFPFIGTAIRIALLTGMRRGEITSLTWGQIDFVKRIVGVGKAKTAAGTGRQIPMNDELFDVFAMHAAWFTERFGEVKPEHYLFPFGFPKAPDLSRPTLSLKKVWTTIRKNAGVQCRFPDLRHTAATNMAESGAPESTMLAIMGHMSRAMLERYSHIRMQAKREAVEALTIRPKVENRETASTKSTTLEKVSTIQ